MLLMWERRWRKRKKKSWKFEGRRKAVPEIPLDNPVPIHVGIIMDGNGRWATARGLPRQAGHREGLETAKRIVKAAEDIGIRYLSLYTFSTENWKRTADEVGFLMGLICRHLAAELDFYRENRIRVIHSGDKDGLPQDVLAEIRKVEKDTATFDRITVNLAINYGGRDEILRAIRRAAIRGDTASIDEKRLAAAMDNPLLPDPDLIIRTGGEMRLSNFLLWESAYSELWFSQKLWPDFDAIEFNVAIDEYMRRNRRFGGTR
jgi:undecaprenyl diphosphate synthase